MIVNVRQLEKAAVNLVRHRDRNVIRVREPEKAKVVGAFNQLIEIIQNMVKAARVGELVKVKLGCHLQLYLDYDAEGPEAAEGREKELRVSVPGADDQIARRNDEAKFEDVVGDDARLEARAVSAHRDDARDRRVGDGA